MRRIAPFVAALAIAACTDVSSYSNAGDHYEGQIAQGPWVRAGFGADVAMTMTFDGDHFQDAPGSIGTNDGRFHGSPLRPIPQSWHDPISLSTFGDGRVKTMFYAVAPLAPGESDALAVVSLMKDASIEVRILRGAPGREGAPSGDAAIFGVFRLERRPGPAP